MNLNGKRVWDITPEEIEYLYTKVHLNNYVYAALNCYHKSKMPLNKLITLRTEEFPSPLFLSVKKLTDLSPYIGNDDSRIVRINYTYFTYKLFTLLKKVKKEDVPVVIELLAALAYIPIVAEKNDDFALWLHPVIRQPDDRIITLFNAIKKDIDVPSFLELCLFKNEEITDYVESPLRATFLFMRAVQSIIIMTENNEDRNKLREAWTNLEYNMVKHERENGLSGKEFPGNIQRSGQIRYRNTIYLYGGDFFRSMGDYETAFDWYTKDIYFKELTDLFGFYLTDMKTTERLICAYQITKKQGKEDTFLKNLIRDCMTKVFRNAAQYAETIIEFIETHPEADISLGRIPDNGRYKLYAGEASRELFLISLFYQNVIRDVKYEEIDYHKFFDF
ncbi:MAG: hypothetical protein JXJ04_00650 [Spirochaetales bacterium]|nr:hypothetical protein [Spirochaetales bacterium]